MLHSGQMGQEPRTEIVMAFIFSFPVTKQGLTLWGNQNAAFWLNGAEFGIGGLSLCNLYPCVGRKEIWTHLYQSGAFKCSSIQNSELFTMAQVMFS